MTTPAYRDLDAALDSLPRSILPARDLWPAIARSMDQPSPRPAPRTARAPWPLALAASLAVCGLVGALGWSVWQSVPGTRPGASVDTTLRVSYVPPQSAAYVAARAALERTFHERLGLLAPATRQRIEADLAVIRKANADIGAALAQDPASPLLLQLLRNTWRQEIELYTSVSRATEPMLSRSTRT